MEVVALLSKLRERGYEWETISAVVHGPASDPGPLDARRR